MSSTQIRVVKHGHGPIVAAGSIVRLHFRIADNLGAFDDDSLVRRSTYSDGAPVVLRMETEVVRPEVLQALIGLAVNSTVIVELSAPLGEAPLFIEIWLIELDASPAFDRTTVVAIRPGMADAIRDEIRRAFIDGRRQANGVALQVGRFAEPSFLALVEEVRTGTGMAAPLRINASHLRSDVAPFIVSDGLFEAVRNRVEQL